jgi:hypothetical protein
MLIKDPIEVAASSKRETGLYKNFQTCQSHCSECVSAQALGRENGNDCCGWRKNMKCNYSVRTRYAGLAVQVVWSTTYILLLVRADTYIVRRM